MRGLIVGFGRAGKRHGQMLDRLGIEWIPVDPTFETIDSGGRLHGVAYYLSLEDALRDKVFKYDFTVICTPPNLHLEQIRQCLDAGLPVLCEKPLCGLGSHPEFIEGQLAAAEALLKHPNAGKVMVAYNWRWNPAIVELHNHLDLTQIKSIEFDFCQYRPSLPDWGLLLDHCSHDLDMFSFITKSSPEIVEAEYGETQVYKIWEITLKNGFIREYLSNDENEPRVGQIRTYYENGNIGITNLQPDPAMYTAMWEAFLSGQYAPGLAEAIKTQRMLEKCQELASE